MSTSEIVLDEAIRGVCVSCNQIVPAKNVQRDGKVYLRKDCPKCGPSEALVSSNVQRWERKRDLVHYDPEAPRNCALNCLSCTHGRPPTLIFLDVTNRCNMNCPICLANIPAMGFEFDPPMEYFDKVFRHIAQFKLRPAIQLFGGEPTVRKDLIEIIELAASYGLSARVVTNGISLADEDYCKRLLATGTQLMFSFDGLDPEIYTRLRKSPKAVEQKLKALENIRKHRKSKTTIMCCTGRGVNDKHIADLVRYCHDRRDFIAALDLIPLTETWGPQAVEAHETTIDDVEDIFAEAVPGAEFIPASVLYRISTIEKTLNLRLTFGGAHPNCESVTALISDGEAYLPLSRYLRVPLEEMADGLMELDRKLGEKLERSLIAKIFGKAGRKFVVVAGLLNFMRKTANLEQVFVGRPLAGALKIAWGLARGRKMGELLLGPGTRMHGLLRIIVLPFEEPGHIDSKRLVDCPAAFAYEHPVTREIGFMPVCAWSAYKNEILRTTAERYGTARKPADPPGGDDALVGVESSRAEDGA